MADLKLLVDAALAVKRSVSRAIKSPKARKIERPGAFGDYTRRIDLVAERAAINFLKREGKFDGMVMSEESGLLKLGNSNEVILLDPLDGTTNAIRGIGFYSVSLALARGWRLSSVESGVVLNLVNGDLYLAEKNGGAFLNSSPIEPSKAMNLDEAVLCVNLSGGCRQDHLEKASKLCALSRHVRSFGSASLELCHVASGLVDAFIDLRNAIRPIDVAAGKLIVEEAGGAVMDERGNPLDSLLTQEARLSLIACGAKQLYFEIIKAIARV